MGLLGSTFLMRLFSGFFHCGFTEKQDAVGSQRQARHSFVLGPAACSRKAEAEGGGGARVNLLNFWCNKCVNGRWFWDLCFESSSSAASSDQGLRIWSASANFDACNVDEELSLDRQVASASHFLPEPNTNIPAPRSRLV